MLFFKKIFHNLYSKTSIGKALAGVFPYNVKKYSLSESNDELISLINKKQPFVCGRLGRSEVGGAIHQTIKEVFPFYHIPQQSIQYLNNNSGMFSVNYRGRHFFKKLLEKSVRHCDAVCYYGEKNFAYENYFVHKNAKPHTKLLDPNVLFVNRVMELNKPWTQYLEGKKILVISTFAVQIERQYEIIDKIFNKKNPLPEFTLKTYIPVVSFGGEQCEYASWKDALMAMFEEIKQIDFDIALLSCGSYGMPLSYLIKTKMKRSALYMGGAIQRMFGIKCKRDIDSGLEKTLYNRYWEDADDSLRPKDYMTVDNGDYW